MRIATYNTEWFSALFSRDNKLMFDEEPSRRYKISRREQIEALGIVFQALDADAVMVIEAPETDKKRSTVAALEQFANDFDLRVRKCVRGFSNHTEQEIALMYDPLKLTAVHDPQGGDNPDSPQFDQEFHMDIDVDGMEDSIVFSKPPLEIALTTLNGTAVRLIGVHAKSKAPYGAKDKDEEIRIAIENRRKQLAQCVWVRRRVVEHLERGEDVIVLGDFNDGPGLDEYEKLFGRSGVEIVLGERGKHCLFDPHAAAGLAQKFGGTPTTSRFFITQEKRYLSALLDYIMVSETIRTRMPHWRIWHPFDDPKIYSDPYLRDALLTASDHFPVSIDVDL